MRISGLSPVYPAYGVFGRRRIASTVLATFHSDSPAVRIGKALDATYIYQQ